MTAPNTTPPHSIDLAGIYQAITQKADAYKAIIASAHACSPEMSQDIFDGQLETYMQRLQRYLEDPANHKTGTPTLSLSQGQNIFLEVMQAGLSFSQVADHIYLSRLKGTGMAIGYQVTAKGLIYLAQKSGVISHASEVMLVLHGEPFRIRNTEDGRLVADHIAYFENRPPFSFDGFSVGYVYIHYPNGARELHYVTQSQLATQRAKSTKPSNYDGERFVKTKIIKAALANVPRTPQLSKAMDTDE